MRRHLGKPIKVTQSIWDASAVATASRGELRFMPFFEGVDLSKLALVRTLEGHSGIVRRAPSCFVLLGSVFVVGQWRCRVSGRAAHCFWGGLRAQGVGRGDRRVRGDAERALEDRALRRPLYFWDDLASS